MFIEQKINGETLRMVSEHGSYDQLTACGLKTVANQMKLQRLITKDSKSAVSMHKKDATTSGRFPGRKLSKAELNELSPEDRRVYIMKYVFIHNYNYPCNYY